MVALQWQLLARTDGLNSHSSDHRLRCPLPSFLGGDYGYSLRKGPSSQAPNILPGPMPPYLEPTFLVRPSQDLQAGPP